MDGDLIEELMSSEGKYLDYLPTDMFSLVFSAGSLVDMLLDSKHIIQILIQPVFALSPLCCMISRESTNTNFIVFGFTPQELEHTINLSHSCVIDSYQFTCIGMYIQ
jgi:hypothetical protein